MEEDIKILEEYINCGFNENDEIRAIKNLLTRYKQLEEENEKLKEQNEHYTDLMNALETYYDITEEDLENSVKNDC